MADNTQLNRGRGGDVARTVDRGLAKAGVTVLDFGTDLGPESLATLANPLPTQAVPRTGAVSVDGVLVTPQFAPISAFSPGVTTLVAGVAGRKVRVLSVVLVVGSAVAATFASHAAGAVTGAFPLASGGGFALAFSPAGHFETADGESLDVVLGASAVVAGCLTYVLV